MNQIPTEFLARATDQLEPYTRRLDELQARFEFLPALTLLHEVQELALQTLDAHKRALREEEETSSFELAISEPSVSDALKEHLEPLMSLQADLHHLIDRHTPGYVPNADPTEFLRSAPGRLLSLVRRLDAARRTPGEHDLGRLRDDVETFGREVIALHGAEGSDPDKQIRLARFIQDLGSEARELLRQQAAS